MYASVYVCMVRILVEVSTGLEERLLSHGCGGGGIWRDRLCARARPGEWPLCSSVYVREQYVNM